MARRRRPSRRYGQLVARIAAPAAFLLAATIAVLLVRAALRDESQPPRPATTAVTTTAPNQGAARAPRPRADRQAGNFYVVQSGDTFGTIADAHGTSVARLVQLNPRVNPRALTVGQRIRVP